MKNKETKILVVNQRNPKDDRLKSKEALEMRHNMCEQEEESKSQYFRSHQNCDDDRSDQCDRVKTSWSN